MKYFAISTTPEMLLKLASGEYSADLRTTYLHKWEEPIKVFLVNHKTGMVVAEYLFISAEKARVDRYSPRRDYDGGYSIQELADYSQGSRFFLWHFTDLVFYNKPFDQSKLVCERTGNTFSKKTKKAYVRLEE